MPRVSPKYAAAMACLGLSAATTARAQKRERAGAEFIDKTEAPPEPVAAKPKPPPEDENAKPGYIPGYRREPSVGLSPLAPQRPPSLPGAFTPAFGAPKLGAGYRFNFTGYLQQPVRISIGDRPNAAVGQKTTTLHGDPVVAGGSYGWFDHTNTVPTPWAQLNFIYGNRTVRATASIGAWSLAEGDFASGYFTAPAQQVFSDAFLTYTPDVEPIGMTLNVGVFSEQFGAMAKYDNGAYSIPLMGFVKGVGATDTIELPFVGDFEGELVVRAAAGFKGLFNKAPPGIIPDNSNGYARVEQGSTYAAHAHLQAEFGWFTPGVHYIYSWNQDDRADPEDDPTTPTDESLARHDASLSIKGADLRMDARRFGYLYAGVSRTEGKDTANLQNLVAIMNTGSRELAERFWGIDSNGTGSLTLFGLQYSVSLGTLLRYPAEFYGEGPDLSVTLFGIYGTQTAELPAASSQGFLDGRNMLKFGAELGYSMTRYVASALRVDQVMPDLDGGSQNFTVIAPKLIFRSDWQTRESVTLQYAGYLLGKNARFNGDNRLNTTSDNPDQHLISVLGTMWW